MLNVSEAYRVDPSYLMARCSLQFKLLNFPNFILKATSEKRLLQLNELKEIPLNAYEKLKDI